MTGVDTLYRQNPIRIHVDSMETEKMLRGITRQNVRTGVDFRAEALSGEVYACHGAIYSIKPMASFATQHVASALSTCAQTGLRITSASKPGVTFFQQQQQEGGTVTSGSTHRSVTIREGLLLPRRLTCSHQGDAEIDYEALATFDGTNAPLVIGENGSLPSATEECERFSLGPIILGNEEDEPVTISQVTQLDVDFGIQAETVGADSEIYDRMSRIVEIMPFITVQGIDPKWFSSTKIPLEGMRIEHSDTSIVLRKRLNKSTFYDGTESEHILLTASGCVYVDTVLDASGSQVTSCNLRMPLTFDGTNTPIAITLNHAYEESET